MSAEWCCGVPDCGERIMCPRVGGVGHFQCGMCPDHERPRHVCGCIVMAPIEQVGESADVEAYTVEQISEAFAKHAHPDDWGVPSFYEGGLLDALRGLYDDAAGDLS